MKTLTLLVLSAVFATQNPALAADFLTCERIGDGKGPQALAIEVTKDTIVTADLDRAGAKPQDWDRNDPGLFSYWGTDSSKVNETNERDVNHVRFDLGDRKTLADFRAKSTFEMEIAFIWESLYFDSSGLFSEDMYSCKKF